MFVGCKNVMISRNGETVDNREKFEAGAFAMIIVRNTPQLAGVEVLGDRLDYERLYEALHTVVGTENEMPDFSCAGTRVLGICYDLRHALQGDREIEFVDNGLDAGMKKQLAVLAPDKNVYLKIRVLWPELLFGMMAINDLIRLYAVKRARRSYDRMLDKSLVWDEAVAVCRLFQSAVAGCLRQTVPAAAFARMNNLMNRDYPWMEFYTRQYVDLLNVRYIGMDRDKRLKSLPVIAKRLAEQGTEYRQLTTAVKEAARRYQATADSIEPMEDYPEQFEW